MTFTNLIIFSLLFTGYYVSSFPFDEENNEGEVNFNMWELGQSKDRLDKIKSALPVIAEDALANEATLSNAQKNLKKMILMVAATENLHELEELFAKINEVSQSISGVAKNIQHDHHDDGVKEAAKKVYAIRKQIKETYNQLKLKTKELGSAAIQIANVLKFESVDPFMCFSLLANNYEFNMVLDGNSRGFQFELNKVLNSIMQVIGNLWEAEAALNEIESEHPSEAAKLKKTLIKVHNKYYDFMNKAKQSIESLDSKFAKANELPQGNQNPEQADFNVTEVINRLSNMLGAPQFLQPMNFILEKVKAKDPQDVALESAIQEVSVAYCELRDWVKTAANKINLDAQNETEPEVPVQVEDNANKGIDILKGIGEIFGNVLQAISGNEDAVPVKFDDKQYAQIFGCVTKGRAMNLFTKMTNFVRNMQNVLSLFSAEENAAMEELIPEIMAMEPVKSFMEEAAKYFLAYIAFDDQDANMLTSGQY